MKRHGFVLILMLLAGAVVGLLVGELSKDISFLSWLNFGETIGFSPNAPWRLQLGIIDLTFGFSLYLSVSVILCMGIAALLYRRFVR